MWWTINQKCYILQWWDSKDIKIFADVTNHRKGKRKEENKEGKEETSCRKIYLSFSTITWLFNPTVRIISKNENFEISVAF